MFLAISITTLIIGGIPTMVVFGIGALADYLQPLTEDHNTAMALDSIGTTMSRILPWTLAVAYIGLFLVACYFTGFALAILW